MEPQNLTNLITPAIMLAIVGYLTHFFGKIIDDIIPFTDNRKWSIEFRGVIFMIDISFGLLGIYLAISKPWGIDSWWIHLISQLIIGMIVAILFFSNIYLTSRYFNIWKNKIDKLEAETYDVVKIFASLNNLLSSGIISLILLYFGTLEYLTKNIYFEIYFFISIFYAFILLAANFSLKKALKDKITPVTIYFIDSNRPILEKVVILKYNTDNIRVRAENTIYILNKSEVSKIEMVIPEEVL